MRDLQDLPSANLDLRAVRTAVREQIFARAASRAP
jgi:hypothetical protein